jgi:hypothetical protein
MQAHANYIGGSCNENRLLSEISKVLGLRWFLNSPADGHEKSTSSRSGVLSFAKSKHLHHKQLLMFNLVK